MSVYNESSMYNGQDPVDTEVHHDSSLSGDGSTADPLSVNFPATNVAHDTTLSGDGSTADPLSVNFLKRIHSFNVDTTGYYKLARVVFPDSMAAYGGVSLAVTWRSVYKQSGSGILTISFAENEIFTAWGRVLITSSRGHDHLIYDLVFAVRRLSAYEYEILCYSKDYQMISFSLLSGFVSTFEAVDSATSTSSDNIQTLRYSVPTVTDIMP